MIMIVVCTLKFVLGLDIDRDMKIGSMGGLTDFGLPLVAQPFVAQVWPKSLSWAKLGPQIHGDSGHLLVVGGIDPHLPRDLYLFEFF
jgi:hypothetical protein